MKHVVMVRDKGEVTIPKPIRKKFNIEHGTRYVVKIEDNVRQTMTQTNTRNTQKTGFINNSNQTTLDDGSSTTPERVALSKLLKPQADN